MRRQQSNEPAPSKGEPGPTQSTGAAPRTIRGQARVAEIMAAARTLFVEGGYGEMTMRKVADRVGISLSNVQHYFSTPESLLRAMLEEVIGSYSPAYAEDSSRFSNPRERLLGAIAYLLEDSRNPATEKLFVEIWSLATRNPTAREIFDRMYVVHRQHLARLIAAVNPSLSPNSVARRAALVAMQIEGLMLLISDSKPKHAELKGIEEECCRALLLIVEAPDHPKSESAHPVTKTPRARRKVSPDTTSQYLSGKQGT